MARVSPQVTARPSPGQGADRGTVGFVLVPLPVTAARAVPRRHRRCHGCWWHEGEGWHRREQGAVRPWVLRGCWRGGSVTGTGGLWGGEKDLERNSGLWEPPRPVAHQLVGPGVRYSLLREAAWGLGVCVCVCVYTEGKQGYFIKAGGVFRWCI